MDTITTKTYFVGTVISTPGKHLLQTIIQSLRIRRLSKTPVFHSFYKEGNTPSLLMNIESNVKVFAFEIYFFITCVCIVSRIMFTNNNLQRLLISYLRLCFYHMCFDILEYAGRTYLYYGDGDQATLGNVCVVMYDGTMKKIYESYFPEGTTFKKVSAKRPLK